MNRTWYRTINLSFDCIFWLFRFLCLFLMLNYFFLSNLGFQCSMRCWLYKKLRLMQVVVFRCQFHKCGCSITVLPKMELFHFLLWSEGMTNLKITFMIWINYRACHFMLVPGRIESKVDFQSSEKAFIIHPFLFCMLSPIRIADQGSVRWLNLIYEIRVKIITGTASTALF